VVGYFPRIRVYNRFFLYITDYPINSKWFEVQNVFGQNIATEPYYGKSRPTPVFLNVGEIGPLGRFRYARGRKKWPYAKQRKLGDNSQHLIQWFPNFFTWWHSFQACKNFAAPLLQSRRHGGGYGGLSLPKQSAKPPQIEIWNAINHWSLCQTFNTVREIAAHELYCCLLPWC